MTDYYLGRTKGGIDREHKANSWAAAWGSGEPRRPQASWREIAKRLLLPTKRPFSTGEEAGLNNSRDPPRLGPSLEPRRSAVLICGLATQGGGLEPSLAV